jgi:hypothetical protein
MKATIKAGMKGNGEESNKSAKRLRFQLELLLN